MYYKIENGSITIDGNTILENINNVGNNDVFVGHIGGDDFVAILGNGIGYEDVCQNIIAQFDKGVKYFFTEEDYNRGYLKIQNRKSIYLLRRKYRNKRTENLHANLHDHVSKEHRIKKHNL